MKYKNLFEDFFEEAFEVCGEWIVMIGFQPVKIRVKQGLDGKSYYETSHYYQGSKHAGPYASTSNGYDTIQEAISSAQSQLLLLRNDNGRGKWIKNENY